MKKIVTSLFVLCLLSQTSFSQETQQKGVRQSALGISFILNDFATAQRIRSGSLEQVLAEDKWSKFREMAPGVALTYFSGISKHLDFAGTLGASFVNYPFPNKPPFQGDALLLEADASAQLKMFSDDYWVTPYVSAGVGASKYKNYYGAFIPLGAGLKINFFDEASVFLNTAYKVAVSAENANYHFTYGIGISGTIGKKK